MALTPGTRLGPYEILSALGAGGMGEVYRARDTRLDRDVAIKILPEAFAADAERVARFQREAKVLASLNHPNIAIIHGMEHAEGAHALVMELVEGEDLAQRIARGAMPLDEALPIAKQIAEALEAAHEQGIIHRDLKPANIKVRPDDTVKVLDFGLAKAMEPTGAISASVSMSPTITTPAMTQAGMILGTAAYMSPEQAKGRLADKRSDIWAFGCVLYEMLTGARPFDGEDMAEVLGAVVRLEPNWEALSADVPPPVRTLLRSCLVKDRRRRVADISTVLFVLEKGASLAPPALGSVSSEPDSAGAATITAGRSALLQNTRVAWGLAASMLLVAVLAIATTLYLRPAAPAPIVTRLDVVTPPTSAAFSFALSPDGRQLAFVANGEKGSQLWLRRFDQPTAQPLTGTEGATFPFWAPDGQAVGFFADGKLKRIDLTGGALQVLADAPTGRGGTWNPAGVIVFAPTNAGPLLRVAAAGGTATAATHRAGRWPQFLPDGRRFLFLAGGVYMGSLDDGEPTHVMPSATAAAYAAPGYLLLVSKGLLAAYPFDAARGTVGGAPMPVAQAVGEDDGTFHSAFSVSASGILAHRAGSGARRQLVWIDRAGKMLGAIGPPDENAPGNPELAPDDQRVAVARTLQGNNDVWLIDVGRGVPSRFTLDVAGEQAPLWSPDGSQVVFRKGSRLFVKPASGTADEQPLLVTSQRASPLDWSRDGRFLLYGTQDPKTGSDIWVLPLTGERKPFAVLQSTFDEIEGQFSPDGRWLAYASNESGRNEIYVRAFPETGGKWLVSAAGGVQPRWRRDSHELFYVAPDARLTAVPIRLAPNTQTLEAGAPVALFPTRLATGQNIDTAGDQARAQYVVAADGRFLMNIAADEAVTSPITLVLNWTAGLKK